MGRAFIAASSTKAQDWHVAGDPNAPLVRAVSYEDLLDAYMPLADYNDGDDANQRRAAQKTLNKAIEASAGEYKHYGNGKSKMVWRPNDIQTGGVLSGLDFSNVTNH